MFIMLNDICIIIIKVLSMKILETMTLNTLSQVLGHSISQLYPISDAKANIKAKAL